MISKKVLVLERVAYGKPETPQDMREYKIRGYGSPVGTVEEWKEFANKHGFDEIEVFDFEVEYLINEEDLNKFKEVEV